MVLVSSAKSQCSNLAARVLPQVHGARRGKQCLAPMHSANTPPLTISHMCKYCTANTTLCKYPCTQSLTYVQILHCQYPCPHSLIYVCMYLFIRASEDPMFCTRKRPFSVIWGAKNWVFGRPNKKTDTIFCRQLYPKMVY